MLYTVNLTPAAIEDIQFAVEYYNSRSPNLGFRYADEVDHSLKAIAKMPTAYSYRYLTVRAKLLNKFPFLIFFIINDEQFTVEVLRIFNTHQDPYWLKDKP